MSTNTLRVATASRPPFVFANNGNSTRYTGFLLDLLPTLLGYAQIAAALEFTLLPEFDVGELVDGQWTGALSCCSPCNSHALSLPLHAPHDARMRGPQLASCLTVVVAHGVRASTVTAQASWGC